MTLLQVSENCWINVECIALIEHFHSGERVTVHLTTPGLPVITIIDADMRAVLLNFIRRNVLYPTQAP